MGSAASPSKKPPAKKAGSAKPNKPRPRPSKGKGPRSSKVIEPTLSAAAVAVAGQHLRIPTNLPVCIVDNGGWTVKYGLVPPPRNDEDINADAGKASENSASMFNATARPPHQLTVLAGDEITTRMKNLGQLSWNHPLERGMICDGETQLRVWTRVLEVLGVVPVPMMMGGGRMGSGGFLATIAAARRGKPAGAVVAAPATMDPTAAAAGGGKQRTIYSSNNCAFLLLEPPFVPSVISEGVDCMLFRELGMARVARMLGPCMAAVRYLSFGQSIPDDAATGSTAANSSGEWINDNTKCCCVVDSGYSFTHIVPTHRGEALSRAIRRLNIGGKVLTNLLKEAVTYRQWNMMDEYHIVNDAKEQLCFITDQFDKEMKQAHGIRKGFRWFDREYLLPDFVNTFRGSVRLPEPLQRKKEMEEMEKIKKEMDRLQDEKEQQELKDEAKDLINMQVVENKAEEDKDAEDPLDNRHGKKTRSRKNKKEKRKIKRKTDKQGIAAKEENEDGDMDESENDSDEESDQQRLQRLKAMRGAERKRREEESLERQALAMSVERFAIPEVLFRPSDIELGCGGIAESIVESINACDPMLRAAMYHNVLLVGGNAKIPGFRDRVDSELRKLAPTNYEVRVHLPNDPASFAWEGAKQFSRQAGFQERYSVDRLSWETMKKAGKNQNDIWGKKIYNAIVQTTIGNENNK
ncbi:hypothetical protein ACHAXR_005506 [Thalassiosira sp. AJA248-18]